MIAGDFRKTFADRQMKVLPVPADGDFARP